MGKAIVHRYVQEGAHVAAFDCAEQRLAELIDELGQAVCAVQGDVTSIGDNLLAVETAVAEFGALDIFVGNAGIWDFQRSLDDIPCDELSSGLFGVNVKGYLLGAKATSPALRATGGTMIFTLSNAAYFPAGGGPLYTASKHAGLGLVRQLAYEYAPVIRVNAVAPGGMATNLRGPVSMGLSGSPIAVDVPIEEIMRNHNALRRAPIPEDYSSRTSTNTPGHALWKVAMMSGPRSPSPTPKTPSTR